MGKIITNDDFIESVSNLVGDEYTVIEPYIKASTPIYIKHNICNRMWKISPDNFKRGRRCKYCSQEKKNKDKSLTFDEILTRFNEGVGHEYTLISRDYKNMKTKMKVRHNLCNNEWLVSMDGMLGKRKTRCPKCSDVKNGINKRKYTSDFKKEIYDLVGDEYELLNSYKTAIEKVELLHTVCGNIYYVEPNAFLNGNRCNHCSRISNSSKGEKRIKEILDNNNIKYIEQYKFDDCKNKFKLPFDFAIIKYKKVSSLIEFDGRQHFEPIDMWGGLDNYNKIKINDDIKNRYCLDNNIELIRIPHWDYENIESIISHLF